MSCLYGSRYRVEDGKVIITTPGNMMAPDSCKRVYSYVSSDLELVSSGYKLTEPALEGSGGLYKFTFNIKQVKNTEVQILTGRVYGKSGCSVEKLKILMV